MKVFVVLSMIVAVSIAAPGVIDNQVQNSEDTQFGNIFKFFGSCADSGDITTCIAVKGISVLNRAARSQNIEILPGVTLTRDPTSTVRAGKSISENEIVTSLPTDQTEKNGRLLDLAMEATSNFLGTHNLQIKLPTETKQEVARAIEEGRGKMKKMMGPLMLALGAKMLAIIPIALGGLVLLATKALVVAKIAFILAVVLGLQKLLGGSGGGLNILGKAGIGGSAGGATQGWPASGNAGWSSGGTQGWSSGGANGAYPYARSYDAQDMAYSAQAPATE